MGLLFITTFILYTQVELLEFCELFNITLCWNPMSRLVKLRDYVIYFDKYNFDKLKCTSNE